MSESKAPRPSWATTAYPKKGSSKKKAPKRKSSNKYPGSSLKRTSTSSSSGTRWGAAPVKRLVGATAAVGRLRDQLRAHPRFVADPDFSGLSIKEEKKFPLPDLLVPHPPSDPRRDQVLNPDRATARKVARMALMGQNAMKTIYPVKLTTFYTMSYSGTGYLNSVIAVNSVTLAAEWTDWAVIFDEFFVKTMTLNCWPIVRYQTYSGAVTTSAAQDSFNMPFVIAATHHGAPSSTNVGDLCETGASRLVSTSDPFRYKWINVENYRTGTAPQASESGTIPTQAWALTEAFATSSYTGQVQMLSATAQHAAAFNRAAAQFMVEYVVYFRCRQ